MRALMCVRHGHWSDLEPRELQDPSPEDGQILVRVCAAGMSFANILAIAGTHQNSSVPPFIPGTEAAGVVVSTGAADTALRPGDRVVASMRRGAFAELATVAADGVFPIPDDLDFGPATLLPTIYATAYTSLRSEARLEPGETVLVHGSAGASGYAAVQVAAALGARVLACASTADKREVALAAGAHAVLPSTGFRDAVLEQTGGRGADIVFDPVGGVVFDESLRTVAPEGRILTIGFASGGVPQIPANIVLVKNVSVIGVNWGYYSGWSPKPPSARARQRVEDAFKELFTLAADEKISPRVHHTLPFDDFRKGFEIIENRSVVGKVVLSPSQTGPGEAEKERAR